MILCGFKGCGKSYWGKRLAEKVGVPFTDTDLLLEELFYEETGLHLRCSPLMRKYGEEKFRTWETKALSKIRGGVIAVGGGALLKPENRALLAKWGKFVYLSLSKERIKTQILTEPFPAFIDSKNPEASFEKMYAERAAIFESLDAVQLPLSGKDNEEILNTLVEHYGK